MNAVLLAMVFLLTIALTATITNLIGVNNEIENIYNQMSYLSSEDTEGDQDEEADEA